MGWYSDGVQVRQPDFGSARDILLGQQMVNEQRNKAFDQIGGIAKDYRIGESNARVRVAVDDLIKKAPTKGDPTVFNNQLLSAASGSTDKDLIDSAKSLASLNQTRYDREINQDQFGKTMAQSDLHHKDDINVKREQLRQQAAEHRASLSSALRIAQMQNEASKYEHELAYGAKLKEKELEHHKEIRKNLLGKMEEIKKAGDGSLSEGFYQLVNIGTGRNLGLLGGITETNYGTDVTDKLLKGVDALSQKDPEAAMRAISLIESGSPQKARDLIYSYNKELGGFAMDTGWGLGGGKSVAYYDKTGKQTNDLTKAVTKWENGKLDDYVNPRQALFKNNNSSFIRFNNQ